MGIFSKLFGKKKTDESKLTLADYLNSFPPIYSESDIRVLESDVFRAGCACICREMRKIHAQHIRMDGNDPIPINDSITYVLNNPNPLMTQSDFFEKITWRYLTQENAFIYPLYEGGELAGLYPLEPTTYKFVEYENNNDTYVQFWFGNGLNKYDVILPYSSLIHLRRNFTRNEYAGGNEEGKFDDTGLKEVVDLNNKMVNGLSKQIKLSSSVQLALKLQSTYKFEEQVKAIKEFEQKLLASDSGVIPMGIDSELDVLNKAVNFIDTNLIKFIDEKQLRPLGVSVAIMSGDYTKDQYEAFYQSALEPIIITFAQAFTKALFTRKQLGHGNKVQFYPEELIFLNTAQKLDLIRLLGDSGSLFINEARVMVGLRPMEELKGQRMMSLNYINAQNASKYQVGEDDKEKTDKDKESIENEDKTPEEGGVKDE